MSQLVADHSRERSSSFGKKMKTFLKGDLFKRKHGGGDKESNTPPKTDPSRRKMEHSPASGGRRHFRSEEGGTGKGGRGSNSHHSGDELAEEAKDVIQGLDHTHQALFYEDFRSRTCSDTSVLAVKRANIRKSNRQDRGKMAKALEAGDTVSELHKSHSATSPAFAILTNTRRLSGRKDPVESTDIYSDDEMVFVKFMQAYHCYDLMPKSAKLVVLDTELNVKKAFFALVYNGVRAAPIWCKKRQEYIGMLCITDFINVLRTYYKSPLIQMEELEQHKISTWRDFLNKDYRPLVYVTPNASLLDAVDALITNRVHRLLVICEETGNALHILTHKRILKFLFKIHSLPLPEYMQKSIGELAIGTYNGIASVTKDTPLFTALNLFSKHRCSALPIVNNNNQVIDLYAKFDVIHLASNKTYNNLDLSVEQALNSRRQSTGFKGVETCKKTDTVLTVVTKLVEKEVHRLIIVDDDEKLIGVCSLSDILSFLVLRPFYKHQSQQELISKGASSSSITKSSSNVSGSQSAAGLQQSDEVTQPTFGLGTDDVLTTSQAVSGRRLANGGADSTSVGAPTSSITNTCAHISPPPPPPPPPAIKDPPKIEQAMEALEHKVADIVITKC